MINLKVPEGFIPHWKDDLSNELYHANRAFISSSQLKHLINESPAFFLDSYNGKPKPPTDAMAIGTLVHHAVLEGEDFVKRYVVMPKFEGHANSTVHKQAKAEWVAAHRNRLVVTEEELQTIEGIYESIFNHADAALLLRGSTFERSGFYVDPSTSVPCRIRYDSYDQSSRIISDLKAVRSCKSNDFQFAIRDYRWDLSMAMYSEGIKAIDGVGPDDQVFIAVEKTRPYQVAVYPIGRKTMQIGLSDYKEALYRLEDCVKKESWPPYQTSMQEIELPDSFIKRYANVY